jgi:hypothetical protein
MATTDPTLAPYLDFLDEAYDRRAWHGPNLKGALRGLRAADAAWRPAEGRHNVWELAVHAAYWKYAVRRQLTGEKRGSFAPSGSNWFARPAGDASDRAFKADLLALGEEHRRLRAVVARLRARDLRRVPRGSRYTVSRLILGAAAHDLYHAGQIQVLKRLRQSAAR